MTATDTRELSSAERLAWLRLIRSENIGPVNFRRLLARFGTAEAAIAALPDLVRRGGRSRPIKLYPREAAESELSALETLGGRLIAVIEPDYPPALAALEDAPPVISALGDLGLLQRKSVAVVGARNASANGRRLARDLAAGLGTAGFVVTSGMARGIDAAAHVGALETGTVAVVAGGLDVVYPPENEALYGEILARGLLVSEMPPATVPQAGHFPRRNRLISGMSLGVLVVEAARRSGSLITARYALEQGREVLAVPGSPLDPRARGCNDLLRQGAVLVESAEDVVEALEGMQGQRFPRRGRRAAGRIGGRWRTPRDRRVAGTGPRSG
jgi:DNA processing protein